MADGVDFDLTGLDSLLQKLEGLNLDVKKKGGRFALRKAANIVAASARAAALRMDDPGTGRSIAKNVAVRWNGQVFKKTGNLAFRVGILGGAKLKDHPNLSSGSPTPHWRLLEFGTEKMAARPFMRPALENNLNQVASTFITEYEKAIDRAIRRSGGGGT